MARREVTGRRPGVTADLIFQGVDAAEGEDAGDDVDDAQRDDPAPFRSQAGQSGFIKPLPPPTLRCEEVVGRKPRPPPTPRLALSIPEFCEAHGISEDFFYKLKRQSQGPRLMKVGARTLISLEAAAEWRREREAAAAT